MMPTSRVSLGRGRCLHEQGGAGGQGGRPDGRDQLHEDVLRCGEQLAQCFLQAFYWEA